LKKIILIYYVKNKLIRGRTYFSNLFSFLSKNFDLTIYSNECDYIIKDLNINCNFVELKSIGKIPIISSVIFNYNLKEKLAKDSWDVIINIHHSHIFFDDYKNHIRVVDINPLQNLGSGNNVRIDRRVMNYFYFRSLKKSDTIFTVGPQLKRYLEHNEIDSDKIKIFPHGVDLNIFDKKVHHSKKFDRFTVIHTGAPTNERGLEQIIDCFTSLKSIDPTIRFLNIGVSEKNEPILKNLIKEKGIEGNFEYKMQVSPEELSYYLSRCHVGLSLLENKGYYRTSPPQKLFEYFALALPVIANDIPTNTQYVSNLKNGVIINYNSDELMSSILKLKNDKILYEKLSDEAYQSSKKADLKIIQKLMLREINNLH